MAFSFVLNVFVESEAEISLKLLQDSCVMVKIFKLKTRGVFAILKTRRHLLEEYNKQKIFEDICHSFGENKDFSAFLNTVVTFDGRDWTYGQFLYKYFLDQAQEFNYYVVDCAKKNIELSGREKFLAEKLHFLVENKMEKPIAVFMAKKIKELNLWEGNEEKYNRYKKLFVEAHSVKGNPCYWHPVAQYYFLVMNHKLSQMGMNSDQIYALMMHCEMKKRETEEYYKKQMPTQFVHNSRQKKNGVVHPYLRSVDNWLTTQKYCFVAEPGSFHSGLPIQGIDNTFIAWPRFKPKVLAFRMTQKEFFERSSDSYNYEIDMSQKDLIHPVIPLWGDPPVEWVSVQDLKYNPEVKTERLQDLIKQGMQFYFVSGAEDWRLLSCKENLSAEDAQKELEKMCKSGQAVRFPPESCNIPCLIQRSR